MTIHESAEDYLEAILILHQRNGQRPFHRHSRGTVRVQAQRQRRHEEASY